MTATIGVLMLLTIPVLVKPQPSTLNPKQSLSPFSLTLNPASCTKTPRFPTPNMTHYTPKRKLRTYDSQPQTLNPEPSTLNRKLKIKVVRVSLGSLLAAADQERRVDPKAGRNRKPYTLYPDPSNPQP